MFPQIWSHSKIFVLSTSILTVKVFAINLIETFSYQFLFSYHKFNEFRTLMLIFLKPSQDKKGRKNFQLHHFLNTFSQLPAVKKYSKNIAAGKFFGPSYFDPALVQCYAR